MDSVWCCMFSWRKLSDFNVIFNEPCEMIWQIFSRNFIKVIEILCVGIIIFTLHGRMKWVSESLLSQKKL